MPLSDSFCTLNPDFAFHEISCEIFLLDTVAGHYFTLNETAALIFKALAAHQVETQILAMLVDTYGISLEQAREDLHELLEQLILKNVIISKTIIEETPNVECR